VSKIFVVAISFGAVLMVFPAAAQTGYGVRKHAPSTSTFDRGWNHANESKDRARASASWVPAAMPAPSASDSFNRAAAALGRYRTFVDLKTRRLPPQTLPTSPVIPFRAFKRRPRIKPSNGKAMPRYHRSAIPTHSIPRL
jgi:hypothetical protein